MIIIIIIQKEKKKNLSRSKFNCWFFKSINSFEATRYDFLKLLVVIGPKAKPLYAHPTRDAWKQLFRKIHGICYTWNDIQNAEILNPILLLSSNCACHVEPIKNVGVYLSQLVWNVAWQANQECCTKPVIYKPGQEKQGGYG